MVQLREYRIEDIPAVQAHADNPNVVAFLRTIIPSPYTDKDAEWWVNDGAKLPGTCNKAIEYNGLFTGNVGAELKGKEAEIGIWLGEEFWGKGIGKTAVIEFTDYIFHNFGINRVTASIVSIHSASIKLFESCGYTFKEPGKDKIEVHAGNYEYIIFEKYS